MSDEYEEIYIADNKTLDDWVEANPNLVNLNLPGLLVYIPLKPYPWKCTEATHE